MGSSPMTGKKPSAMFDPSASRVKEVKNFPRNMEISSQMNYNGQSGPLTLVVRRSIVELDKDPMHTLQRQTCWLFQYSPELLHER